MLSNLPISPGDSVWFFALERDSSTAVGIDPADFYSPISLPICGEYDDYGKIRSSDPLASFIVADLSVRLNAPLSSVSELQDTLLEHSHVHGVLLRTDVLDRLLQIPLEEGPVVEEDWKVRLFGLGSEFRRHVNTILPNAPEEVERRSIATTRLNRLLTLTRRSWHPTTGTGYQVGVWPFQLEYAKAVGEAMHKVLQQDPLWVDHVAKQTAAALDSPPSVFVAEDTPK